MIFQGHTHQRHSVDGVAKFPTPSPQSFTTEQCVFPQIICAKWHILLLLTSVSPHLQLSYKTQVHIPSQKWRVFVLFVIEISMFLGRIQFKKAVLFVLVDILCVTLFLFQCVMACLFYFSCKLHFVHQIKIILERGMHVCNILSR